MRKSRAQSISNLYDAVIGDYVLAGYVFENSPTRIVIDRKIERKLEARARGFPIDSPMYMEDIAREVVAAAAISSLTKYGTDSDPGQSRG